MKKAPLVAAAFLAAPVATPLALVPAALALEGNSRPQPVVQPHVIPLPADKPYPGTMQLRVDASDVARGIFHVRQTIPVAKPGKLTLLYPEWLPGKHAPRGAIAEVAGFKATAGGKALAWTRQPTDVYAFDIDVPAGAKSIEVVFDFLSPTRSSEGRVVVTPAMMNLQWEQVSLYPAGYFTRQIPVQLDVTLPQGWTGVAALDGLKVNGNRYSYAATDYETLVDSPMFAGRHFRKWDLGHNVTLNIVADEDKYLAASPDHIARHAALVSEAVALFGVRHFDRYEFLLALTDELGGIGLEHHRSSENSRNPDYFTKWDDNDAERGLLPHELVHSWNGKYRRPDKLWTPDYRTPMQDNLLWVYEGQTSYWDLVLAGRSGMQSKETILGEWAAQAANYSVQPGRSWRSVEDTTLDPIIAARKSKPFASWSRTEDYYNEGSLMWLEADMLIRGATRHRKSLDDFARAFFGGREGDWGQATYDFGDVVAALNAVHPYDWERFLRDRMQTAGRGAPVGGIERAGYRLVWRDAPNSYDRDRMAQSKNLELIHSLGLTLNKDGVASNILWDGAAFRADIVNGTKIVAVDGLSYSKDRMEAAIRAAADGKTPVRLLVERDGRYRNIEMAYHGGLRWPHLEKVEGTEDGFDRLLAPKRTL